MIYPLFNRCGGILKKIVIGSLIVLVVLVILAWFGGRWILSFSVADYQGEIHLSQIEKPVEVTFDGRGVPQIWAETDNDLYFSLGWLHASERLFQMELTRRYVRGELSEIFGPDAYEIDRRQRLLAFRKKGRMDSEQLSPEVLAVIKSYCEGINTWIERKKVLPPEFVLLGFSPKPWQVKDVASIVIYQTWFAHSLMDRDRDYTRLVEELGPELQQFLGQYQNWSPPTVHDSFLKTIFSDEAFPFRMSRASNSWAVAPQKSASGAAIHASDPHLRVNTAPGFWYLAGLHSREGTNILGVTVPGLPFVLMGHNGKIAFSFTVASVDVIDYYRFKRHPQDSLLILMPDGYRSMKPEKIQIAVEGESRDRREVLYYTDDGPVLEMDSTQVLVLRWAGQDFNAAEMLAAGLGLQHAENFEEFRRQVTRFGALDVNWAYSDAQGNIGYQLGAPIPIREVDTTYTPLAGENIHTRWQGYRSPAETPYLLNPAEGWFATCNNQIVSPTYPFPIPGFYDPYRIPRATELLQSREKFSATDFQTMQLDRVSGVALRWKNLLAEGAKALQNDALAAEINRWDGEMAADSPTAALFRLWWEFLGRALFEDELDQEWSLGRHVQEEVLSAGLSAVIDDRRTADRVETARDISAAALQYVLDTFGRPIYGDVSKLLVRHPLGRVRLLNAWLNLNRGPFPMGGDKGTINANFNLWDEKGDKFYCLAAPSMRFVLDWADIDGFTINGNLGQSGNPFSPHYDDFLEMMQTGSRWHVPFSRGKVFENRQSLLRLLPE